MKTQTFHYIHKMLAPTALAIGVAVLSSGCSINMQHAALNSPATTRAGAVNVAESAVGSSSKHEGADGRVGWGRFTLFAIPVVPVHVNGDGNAALSGEIQAALTQAGYTPKAIEANDPMSGKVLTCQVDKFGFSNYTWLFPIVPTWGNIQLDLSLNGPGQNVLWSRHYSGRGATLNFFDGYTISSKSAMTKILNQMVADFDAQDFYEALNK